MSHFDYIFYGNTNMENNTKSKKIRTPKCLLEFKHRPHEIIFIGNPDDVLTFLGKDYEYVGLCTYRLKGGNFILKNTIESEVENKNVTDTPKPGQLRVTIFQALPSGGLEELLEILRTTLISYETDMLLFPELFVPSILTDKKLLIELKNACDREEYDRIKKAYGDGTDNPDAFWLKQKKEEEEARMAIIKVLTNLGIGVAITGNDYTSEGLLNSTWIYDKDGILILKYDKQKIVSGERDERDQLDHRFNRIPGSYKQGFKGSYGQIVTPHGFITIGCMICADLEEVDIREKLKLALPSLVFNPSAVNPYVDEENFGEPIQLETHQKGKVNSMPGYRLLRNLPM